jgi:hypothetical protein
MFIPEFICSLSRKMIAHLTVEENWFILDVLQMRAN